MEGHWLLRIDGLGRIVPSRDETQPKFHKTFSRFCSFFVLAHYSHLMLALGLPNVQTVGCWSGEEYSTTGARPANLHSFMRNARRGNQATGVQTLSRRRIVVWKIVRVC